MAIRVRVRGVDPPGLSCGPSPDQPGGYSNVHAALQCRQEYVHRTPGDAPFAAEIEVAVRGGRLGGPYVHGRGHERFLYLAWGEVDGDDFRMFRRGKIHVDHLDADELDGQTVEVTVVLRDHRGHPRCASIRPDDARWRTVHRD